MAYETTNSRGQKYFLYANSRKLKSGKKQLLYYFSKTAKEGALDVLPAGYKVVETKNGLPVLKRA